MFQILFVRPAIKYPSKVLVQTVGEVDIKKYCFHMKLTMSSCLCIYSRPMLIKAVLYIVTDTFFFSLKLSSDENVLLFHYFL